MNKTQVGFAVVFLLLVLGIALISADSYGKSRDSKSPNSAAVLSGLAAKYPGDQGLFQDSSVVFYEDFETGDVTAISQRWTSMNNKDERVISLMYDNAPDGYGKRSLEITANRGHDTGGDLWKLLDKGYDQLYLRFYVKFASDHPYMHHFVAMGGRVDSPQYPIPNAGSRPAGTDYFWTFMDLPGRSVYAGVHPPGGWSFYSYWCEMHSWQTPEGQSDGRAAPFYGNLFGPVQPVQARRGEWQCVEFMIKLNDPELSNGEQAFWIDGRLVERYGPGTIEGTWFKDMFRRSGVYNTDPKPFEGFRWRKTDQLQINNIWLEEYVASTFENDYNPHDETIPYNDDVAQVFFDNIVVATEYIGPISTGETGYDFDGDGEYGLSDVLDLVRRCIKDAWDPAADVNGDGKSNVLDVLSLLLDLRRVRG